jgi:hypothetical protein
LARLAAFAVVVSHVSVTESNTKSFDKIWREAQCVQVEIAIATLRLEQSHCCRFILLACGSADTRHMCMPARPLFQLERG